MEPLIGPWLIYFINIISTFRLVLFILSIISGLFCICNINEFGVDDSKFKICKYSSMILIPCIILLILTPTRNTMYEMLVMKNITPDNIKALGNGAEKSIDIIIEKITNVIKDGVQ